jgi:hypothetical protein
MELKTVRLEIPEGVNLILGMSHFIKTVEDLYEAIVNTNPGIRFGVAFNEASGPRLVRADGNDEEMRKLAVDNALLVSAGHAFVICMKNGFPINVTGRIKDVPEVCRIFCATSNALEVVIAETDGGRGILGVVDGNAPLGVETEKDVEARRAFLRNIGYKR